MAAYTPFGGESKSFRSLCAAMDAELKSVIWAVALWASAAATCLALVQSGETLPSWWIIGGLALVAGAAERHGVTLLGSRDRGIEIAVSFVPFVFTAVVFGPLAAFAVGALGNLADFRAPHLRWAVYTPARALTGTASGFAAMLSLSFSGSTLALALLAALFAAVAHLAVDVIANMSTLAIRGSASPLDYPRAMGPLFLVAIPLYVPLIAFLVYGYEAYSLLVVVTFLLPVVALQKVVHLYREQRTAARNLAEANRHLEAANISFAGALVMTLDARDRYTAGHSAAVAIYSRDIARRLDLSTDAQAMAHLCGLVHDIGKIGLPVGLLEKPGPLTLDERRQMQEHSAIGERILEKVEDYAEIARIVRHHHERVDGNGYPDGLTLDDIPVISRIIAVADAYNAMTSDRPYREAMPSRVARLRLAQAVESQFDTAVVAAFEALLAGSGEDYRTGTGAEFDFQADQTRSLENNIAQVA
jgi:putative nucleotidyltransferase with HDIG domain